MSSVACAKFSPNSFSCGLPFITMSNSLSVDTPVFCAVFVTESSTMSRSLACSPYFSIACFAFIVELVTSEPFICANFIIFSDAFSNSWPVNPNCVLISPMAFPTSSKEAGILDATFLKLSSRLLAASPVAPVFDITVSRPLSTSLKAAIDRPPIAAIGAVTPLVMAVPTLVILSPALVMVSPTSLHFELVVFSCPSRDLSWFSVFIISRVSASYLSCPMSPLARASFACSCDVFSVSNFFFVLSTDSASTLCFWAIKSELPGLNLREVFISLSSLLRSLEFLFTSFKALSNLVVSPPISIVIPFIFPAIFSPAFAH